MNGIEFAYWLQGHFELEDGDNKVEPLTLKQVDAIKKHHQLAKLASPNDPFLNLMEGLLEGFNLIDAHCEEPRLEGVNYNMRIWITDRINDKLQEKFKNVTSEFTSDGIVDMLEPLISPNVFVNPHQTCSLVPSLRGSARRFC